MEMIDLSDVRQAARWEAWEKFNQLLTDCDLQVEGDEQRMILLEALNFGFNSGVQYGRS